MNLTARAYVKNGPQYQLSGVAYGNGQFIAVGDGGTVVASTDGVNWVQRPSQGTNLSLGRLVWGSGRFVALGSRAV